MNSTSILKSKLAVIFGAVGSIGSAVAKEFAREGAEVFLSGRTKSSVEAPRLSEAKSVKVASVSWPCQL